MQTYTRGLSSKLDLRDWAFEVYAASMDSRFWDEYARPVGDTVLLVAQMVLRELEDQIPEDAYGSS